MNKARTSRRVILVALVVGVGVAVVVIRNRQRVAIETANEIEEKLSELDPATRAGVVSHLAKDSIEAVRSSD